jgi:putative hydrolase of the HAD superfamily
MIRAILFDAAGTLIYLPRGVGWHYREVAARHGLDVEEKRIGEAFVAAFQAATPRLATEASPTGDDKAWWRALVREVLAACGQQPAEPVFEGLFEELYAHFAQPGVWALYPEAAGVLEALRGKYRLGVVSNFDRRLYAVLEDLGVRAYFERIVISSELGVHKPDGRIFAAALAAFGVAPSETVLAGDDPEQDWRAGEAAGLHVYRVARPATTLEGLEGYVRGVAT